MDPNAPTPQDYYGEGAEQQPPPGPAQPPYDQEHHQEGCAAVGYPQPFPEAEKEARQEQQPSPTGEKETTTNNTNNNDKASPPKQDQQQQQPTPTDDKENEGEGDAALMEPTQAAEDPTDPIIMQQNEIIANGTPTTPLEIALTESLKRKEIHITRLTNECVKLKAFISKRKQTYKRKRKDDGAPTRAISAYNFFIKDRFAQLSKDNEKALLSESADATMKRVPPSSLISSTGSAWKELSSQEKQKYEEQAKQDRKRFEEEMARYNPPDKQSNRKRNKTGYNMFFSAHVLRLKQTESGVPSERGSVARLVGTAWKQLPVEDKAYYEKEADKHNGMQPKEGGGGEDDDDGGDEETKRQQQQQQQHTMEYPNYPPHHPDLHLTQAQQQHMPPPPPQYDHRQQQHYYHHHHHMYGGPPPPPYHGYDYSQHHQRQPRGGQNAYQPQPQGYPPPPRHGGYEG